MKIPVAVFTYNRPDHTGKALEALSQCRGLEQCLFYFFSDAPRDAEAIAGVEKTRAVLQRWASKLEAKIVERSDNLGLSKSIVTGVSSLCETYGQVIVVEDDLVVSPDFLVYMVAALQRYQHEPSVMQVSGCTLASPEQPQGDAFFLPVTTTWGWATWQRAWQHFAWMPEGLDAARKENQWLALFNLGGAYNYLQMLDDRLAGRNDSWGILWWYAVSRQQGLVLYPTTNLVQNTGFDGSGIHCGSGDSLGAIAPTMGQDALANQFFWPDAIAYDVTDLNQLKAFLSAPNVTPVAGNQNVTQRILKFFKAMLSKMKIMN
ncbi:hemolysin activation protein [Nodosilinea sp. LEGE 07088]|uniref:hemolysin activation protein n=1 Tax=Nodosilinea sp. LEGE 07088 TaxID=2777968 RepID=UPI00187E545B|nr:hemolysin activation protein [Nodosilinea sp. LEGE 07088]MBE9139715.1 hemolysin activation protein [Nodosilinea sp. LEGE 07088]